MAKVEYTGLHKLEPLEQTIVKGISEEYYPKVKREAKNDIDLLVHVKSHHKTGNRAKYSVHVKMIYATKTMNIDHVADWDLPKAVHEAFVALMNLTRGELKNSSSKYKKRKSTQKSEKQVIRRAAAVKKNKKKSSVKKKVTKKRSKTI